MSKRAYNSAFEVEQALNEIGLYKTRIPTLYLHPAFQNDPNMAIRIELWEGMTPRERGQVVDHAIERLQALKEELKARRDS